MSRRKKGEECNADNLHDCLNEIERSFQTLLNTKIQRKGDNIEAALHPIIVVKNARVEARAEVRRHNNAISVVCGDRDCNCSPRGVSDSTKSRGGREMTEVFKYIGERG